MSQAIVDQVDRQFPALLRANTNETCAAFCYHACLALGGDWRLLGKSGGENGHTWPNGARTSHDAICHVNASGAKVAVVDIIVGAGSGSPASPGWGDIPSHEWRASNTPVALSAVPAPGGGTPTPTTPTTPTTPGTPSADWTAAHADVLLRIGTQATTRIVAEQFAFLWPDQGWGLKAADPSRPISDNVIARRSPFGRLVGFRVVPASASPEGIDLTGQYFVSVEGVDHLGLGPAPTVPPTPTPTPVEPSPGPAPTPTPTPTPTDVQAVLAALAALDAKLSAVQFPSYEGTIRAFGADLPVTLRPKP